MEITLAAVAMGAEVVEKHLTLDRALSGPDHAASLEPDEMRVLVDGVRAIEAARGDGVKRPVPSEADHRGLVRKSIHAARALQAGERLAAGDLVALRPGTGIPPYARDSVVGRVLARAVAPGAMLREDDLA